MKDFDPSSFVFQFIYEPFIRKETVQQVMEKDYVAQHILGGSNCLCVKCCARIITEVEEPSIAVYYYQS